MQSGAQKQGRLSEMSGWIRPKSLSLLFATVVFATLAAAAPLGMPKTALIGVTFALSAMLLVFVVCWSWTAFRKASEAATLRRFIDRDMVACIVTDSDGRVLSFNSAAEERCGSLKEASLLSGLRQVLANPGPVLLRLRRGAETQGAAREDVVTRKGHVRLMAQRLDSGSFVWRFEDLEEKRSSSRSNPPELPMLVVGRNDTVVSMNDAARSLVGAPVRALDRLFVSPPSAHGQVSELRGKDGTAVSVATYSMEGSGGNRFLYLLPVPDDARAVSHEAIDELPVPLLRVSSRGDVLAYNGSAQNLVGDMLREGVFLSDLMEGLGRSIGDWLGDAIEGRAGQNSEFLRLRRSDKEVFVQVTLTPIQLRGETGLVAVLSDATELKTLEAQFVQSQKMQAIGQLAGGVAHDFNNLLTAISGHCDLLLLRHDQGDHDYADLVQINQNANRAAALVSQLLAFSRKQTLRPKTLDMRDTLADLSHLLNRLVGERVRLKTTYDPVLPPIRADKRQLEQVLMNLVVNARDAMPEGGEIRLTCERIELSGALSRDNATVPAGTYVHVTVSDDGIGIPVDKLQKVFEPFFTTKRTDEGTGLGLSTAYGIVKQTGGFIFVDSIVGTGTTFSLYLPAQDRDDVRAEDAAPVMALPSAPAQAEGVVLLVEDEAPVRAFASRALRLRGYTVLEADSAEAALETLSDASLSIDVFVTDVVMPGMDGPSWVKKALKQRPDTRVVFVSGYAEDSFGETQARIPNSVFLPKPFSLTDLAETVHRQLH